MSYQLPKLLTRKDGATILLRLVGNDFPGGYLNILGR